MLDILNGQIIKRYHEGYRVFIGFSKADDSYLISAPDFPGCVADGKTIEMALNEIDIVVEMWKEVISDRNFGYITDEQAIQELKSLMG